MQNIYETTNHPQLPYFINKYDINILKDLIHILKDVNYLNIQYIPANRSFAAIIKEHKNLFNFFFKKRNHLFFYSIYPPIYIFSLRLFNKDLPVYFNMNYYNQRYKKDSFYQYFGFDLTNRCIANNILIENDNLLHFTLCFVPNNDMIIIRDPYYTYPPYGPGKEKFENRIWMGSDSIYFATFLENYLKNKVFDSILEIGSGSGLQIMTASRFSSKAMAIDYNKRAVTFTRLNAAINDLQNIASHYSDLFENIDDQYDLILANPWFCELKTGGMEEVPSIINGLQKYLRKDGLCIMILNTYVINGTDNAKKYLSAFAKREKYDLELITFRYNLEPDRIEKWKEHNISYGIYYYMILKKNGNGNIVIHSLPLLRKFKNLAYIYWHRIINKKIATSNL